MFTVALSGHEHRLHNRPYATKCEVCCGSYRGGYYCRICKFTIHKVCAFVFTTQETFENPSHVGHHLKLLTKGAPDHTDPKCHICGKNTKRFVYHCFTCNLNMDVDCMVDAMLSETQVVLPWHSHPLFVLDFGDNMRCQVCGRSGEYGYFCLPCRLMIHTKCFSKFMLEITHPSHARHPLKLLTNGAPGYTDKECHICGEDIENLLYHCDMCKFNLDLNCAVKKTPPVSLSNLKIHHHTLTLMPRMISFICDACGTKGDRAPYVCLECDFMMVHQKCARLPRVIHVSHHDHRVSYTYPLGPGEWRCGVCWEEIDWSYGAYSCSICPSYALHPKCATRRDVWDGKELDGVPEEDEDIEPFKVNIDDNTITHFAHEHNMSVEKEGVAPEESILCGACVRPIGDDDMFYNCSECSFLLHETCANNLPKKKRHFLSPTPLSLLNEKYMAGKECDACLQRCCQGFMYTNGSQNFDLLCISLTVPFNHGSHPDHPLIYLGRNNIAQPKACQSCGIRGKGVILGCIKCDFFLDLRCATLPLTVTTLHRYDDHSLTLCYGEKASDNNYTYWCDICERQTNPETWFYTCKDCGVTLHVFCVLGDLKYAKPGGDAGDGIELLPNNTSSRPLCSTCRRRCPAPFILQRYYDNVFQCSFHCFLKSISIIRSICPPWAPEPNT